MLADMGADVVLVERPGSGYPARQFPGLFEALNRQKRSLALDLKTPDGVETFRRLAHGTDVISEGFRPGVAQRLGVGYEQIRAVNPGILYVSIAGYGQEGPYTYRPGHDLSYQGLSGVLTMFDHEFARTASFEGKRGSATPGLPLADLASSTVAAWATMVGLVRRIRTGQGAYLDVSMTDTLVSWMTPILGPLANRLLPTDFRDEPGYGVYETAERRWLTVSVAHETKFWRALCQSTGLQKFAQYSAEDRRKHGAEIIQRLKEVFLSANYDTWATRLEQASVPFGPVLDPSEVLSDSHFHARQLFHRVVSRAGVRTVPRHFWENTLASYFRIAGFPHPT